MALGLCAHNEQLLAVGSLADWVSLSHGPLACSCLVFLVDCIIMVEVGVTVGVIFLAWG